MKSDITNIIKGCKKGKLKYQKALYDKYAELLYAISLRYVKDQSTAQDVVHDSFIIFFNQIKKLKDDNALIGWMKRIVVNESLNQIKKNNKFDFKEDNFEEVIEDDIKDQRIPKEVIINFLEKIPEGCKIIFKLYVIEDYSHKEIAEQLNISESTSKTQYRKAKSLLKEMIVKYEKSTIV